MLSAVAAVTSRMKIGSAVYHILGRTPATLALQALGMDELSRGRFLLGVGSSNPTIARWHGLTMDHPLGRIQEYLSHRAAGHGGEKLDFTGQYFSSHGFKMAFKPGKNPPPISLAAFGPQMTKLAGKITDGVLINMANPGEIRRIADAVHEDAKEGGKDPAKMEIICKIRCSIAPTYGPRATR